MKNKKYLKILIVVVLSCILITVFNQIVARPLSGELSLRNIKVSLIVLDKKYEIEIKEGSTVYDAMKSIESVKDNNFSFKTKEYPSLGIFVDGINGIMGKSGQYWIYYVNDKEASVSVSKYKINNGDVISWKYEK
jgi:hypothetical protein